MSIGKRSYLLVVYFSDGRELVHALVDLAGQHICPLRVSADKTRDDLRGDVEPEHTHRFNVLQSRVSTTSPGICFVSEYLCKCQLDCVILGDTHLTCQRKTTIRLYFLHSDRTTSFRILNGVSFIDDHDSMKHASIQMAQCERQRDIRKFESPEEFDVLHETFEWYKD